MDAQQLTFTIAITVISRVIFLRDRLLSKISRDARVKPSAAGVSRHAIPSGKNVLDAMLVRPEANAAHAGLLICHGIGETVGYWLGVQQLLAANGVASLVFDYSGYGRSSGFFSAGQSEQDALAAFQFLQQTIGPLPVSILGFSLGSGVAAAIVFRVPAHRLFLCAAFTSLRKATVSVGIPKAFQFAVPPIWDAEQTLRGCTIPVLVVHGENDRLFPSSMAQELVACCGSTSELANVPRLGHNEPYLRPHLSYWKLILDRLL